MPLSPHPPHCLIPHCIVPEFKAILSTRHDMPSNSLSRPFYTMTFQFQKQTPTNPQSLKKENLIGWNGGRFKTSEIGEASDGLKKFVICLMFMTMSLNHQEKFK